MKTPPAGRYYDTRAGSSFCSADWLQHRPPLNPFLPFVKSIPPLRLDPPSQLGFVDGSTLALALVIPGIDIHSVAFGCTGFAGS